MDTHQLKILPQYFDAQVNGTKQFEIREYDRDFKVGDQIHLCEVDSMGCYPTGRECLLDVTYLLASVPGNEFEGLEPCYCIMSTELVKVL